ncbi:MAG: hypothetical protein R3F11_06445 [Verrucomicrobiales bacterium]
MNPPFPALPSSRFPPAALRADIKTHEVASEFQPAGASVRACSRHEARRREDLSGRLSVAGRTRGRQPGDGIGEAEKLGLADKLGAIFAEPSLPYRCRGMRTTRTDKAIRQESHLIKKAVVPFIEKTHPAKAEPSGTPTARLFQIRLGRLQPAPAAPRFLRWRGGV